MQTPEFNRSSGEMRRALGKFGMGLVCLLGTGCSLFRSTPVDPALEATRVRLMEGAITRDQAVIQSLLAPDFAWREDHAPVEEEPYDFWNRHRLWSQFGVVLKESPIRHEGLMVAPKDSFREGYKGPKVAWRQVGGEWRLAYFYPGTVVSE